MKMDHERSGHPLDSVLDRLMTRERSAGRKEAEPSGRVEVRSAVEPSARRMLVIAGTSSGMAADSIRAVVNWALSNSRLPAVLDLEVGAEGGKPEVSAEPDRAGVPLAVVPCGLERLQAERPEIVAPVLERLRRHEVESDLLVVHIPVRYRMVLVRAAFLAGGLVVPLDGTEAGLSRAYGLTREIQQSFHEIRIWPLPVDRAALEKFSSMTRDFLGIEAVPLGERSEKPAGLLEGLPGPPEEGFLTAVLGCGENRPSGHLLRIGRMEI